MERTEIEAAFRRVGLAERAPEIDLLLRPSIRLESKRVNEETLQLGTSKIGGHPDLPAGTPWPIFKGEPQSFLAQLQLSEMQGFEASGLLPPQGMLWFFYDARQETYGEELQDRQGWRILFSSLPQTRLQRLPAPTTLPAASLFSACALSPRNELTLALQPELEIPGFDWSEEEQLAYEQVLELLRNPAELALPRHRLLGYPDTIQDDMRLQCQLLSNGITDSEDPRVARLQAGANDWLLLLQLDTDADAQMRWANNGMLYYWVRQADLQTRHFEQGWLVLQSE